MRWWSRVSILITIALVFANAQCFAHCLTQADDSSSSHCHQHSPGKNARCVQQHDSRVVSTHVVAADFVAAGAVGLADPLLVEAASGTIELLTASPPLFGNTILLPLRV